MKTSHRAHISQRTSDERGMAAIVITMVTMVVISLIVIGFATISRREQSQSLDQLLSSQAFYAAESGVEDAKSIIKAAVANREAIKAKTNCNSNDPGPGNDYPIGDQTKIDSEYNVSYTCLKVDPAPEVLKYDGVGENSIIVPITTARPTTQVEIKWRPSTTLTGRPSSDCPTSTNNSFSTQANWRCGYGVVRADIVPTSGTLTRAGLAGGQLTAFLQPLNRTVSGTLAYNAGSVGRANVVAANCTATSYVECKATITGLNSTSFSVRLSSIYQPSSLFISAFDGPTPQGIIGVQAIIDSTGKATDVLRRIQVRLPLVTTGGVLPNYAIQSNASLCKRFATSNDSFSIPDIIDADEANAMCTPPRSDGDIPVQPSTCTVDNEIIMVLDRSGSMSAVWDSSAGTAMGKLKEVSRRFVQTTDISNTGNRAGIVAFSTDATLGVPLTSNTGQLLSYINSLEPDGETYYLTGLNRAAQELSGARPGNQKVVVFVSDGAPESGEDGNTPESLSEIRSRTAAMKSSGIRMYTVGIDGRTYAQPDDPFNEQLLKDMSSGDEYYSNVNSEAELGSVLEKISRDLRCI